MLVLDNITTTDPNEAYAHENKANAVIISDCCLVVYLVAV